MSSNTISLSTYYLKKEEIENAFGQGKNNAQAIKDAIDGKASKGHEHNTDQIYDDEAGSYTNISNNLIDRDTQTTINEAINTALGGKQAVGNYLPSDTDGSTTGNLTATTNGKGIITANQFKVNGKTSGSNVGVMKSDGSVDTGTYVKTSSTPGYIKNDGTIGTPTNTTYTADNSTLQMSNNNQFSIKNEGVTNAKLASGIDMDKISGLNAALSNRIAKEEGNNNLVVANGSSISQDTFVKTDDFDEHNHKNWTRKNVLNTMSNGVGYDVTVSYNDTIGIAHLKGKYIGKWSATNYTKTLDMPSRIYPSPPAVCSTTWSRFINTAMIVAIEDTQTNTITGCKYDVTFGEASPGTDNYTYRFEAIWTY